MYQLLLQGFSVSLTDIKVREHTTVCVPDRQLFHTVMCHGLDHMSWGWTEMAVKALATPFSRHVPSSDMTLILSSPSFLEDNS